MSKTSEAIVEIRDIGALGDGIAEHNGVTLMVPFTCTKDRVRVQYRIKPQEKTACATLLELLEPSPHRQLPPCKHFGTCGGCQLQHIGDTTYTSLKQQRLQKILKQLKAETATLLPIQSVGAQSRRRVEWEVRVHKKAVTLGYHQPRSHTLVAIEHCPVLLPTLEKQLPLWKSLLSALKKPSAFSRIALTSLQGGVDAILFYKHAYHSKDKEALREAAQNMPLLRLTLMQEEKPETQEIMHSKANATICFGENPIAVNLPPHTFLQASPLGEAAIIAFITRHLKQCPNIADIYAGCGTYSLPLMLTANHVSAWEGSPDMAGALHNAVMKGGAENKLTVHCRDLYKEPLSTKELTPYEGIVINPPRNGALPQCKEVAASKVKKCVMVSCNPATFQRDAEALLAGGYRLTECGVIDQFMWSSHMEVVAAFERDESKTEKR